MNVSKVIRRQLARRAAGRWDGTSADARRRTIEAWAKANPPPWAREGMSLSEYEAWLADPVSAVLGESDAERERRAYRTACRREQRARKRERERVGIVPGA